MDIKRIGDVNPLTQAESTSSTQTEQPGGLSSAIKEAADEYT